MHISDPGFQTQPEMILPGDEVHLWSIDLAAVATGEARWQQILSPDERSRAGRFHSPRDRQYFTATRALLRTLLGGYLACNPQALTFRYTEQNKPYLDPGHGAIEFNVSHSGLHALLAFTRGRAVGVDVEAIRNDFDHEALARRFFSQPERNELAALPSSEKCSAFFRCWTRKEAYLKAHGAGLTVPLHAFDVSLEAGAQDALIATRPEPGEAALWSLREVAAAEGYAAALCAQGKEWILKS
jgi:4'-phosphopantetheinyl transferase